MAQTTVSTPNKPLTQPIQDSPGTWRHPRLAEINRRQEATTFSEKNVRRIALNICVLLALVILRVLLARVLPSKQYFPKSLVEWTWFIYQGICLIPLFNVAANLFPIIRPKDDLSDIPLTPGQRKLLGLPPSSKPLTPGSVYSTPPRFSRTPSVGSATSRRSFSSSPGSTRGSPISGNGGSLGSLGGLGGIGSPSSPLLQKAMNGARRSSFGSPSSMGASLGASLFGVDSPSPSPANGKRSSIGLNNKWLYEKGRERRSSGNARLFT